MARSTILFRSFGTLGILQQRVDGLEDGDGIGEDEGDELLKRKWKARIALAMELLGLLLDGGGT